MSLCILPEPLLVRSSGAHPVAAVGAHEYVAVEGFLELFHVPEPGVGVDSARYSAVGVNVTVRYSAVGLGLPRGHVSGVAVEVENGRPSLRRTPTPTACHHWIKEAV